MISAAAGKSTARPSVSMSRKRVKPRQNFLFFISFRPLKELRRQTRAYARRGQVVSRAGKNMSRVVKRASREGDILEAPRVPASRQRLALRFTFQQEGVSLTL